MRFVHASYKPFLKPLVALLLSGCFLGVAFAQTPVTVLTGRVFDARTGQLLPFATVYLNNSSQGTNADQNGLYRLTNVSLGNQELVASGVGYQAARQLRVVIQGLTKEGVPLSFTWVLPVR